MTLRRAEVESSFYQRSIQSRDHAGQQKHITCHQVTGSQNRCISYSCYTIKASCWFMGGKLLVWSGSSRKCWVCMSIIKLSWYLKEGTGTWEWNYTPNYRDSVRSYRSPASSPESILWRKRTNKTAYDSSSAQTDLGEVEGWGSLLARPPSSAGPPGASSSGAASSSSFCLARLLWL